MGIPRIAAALAILGLLATGAVALWHAAPDGPDAATGSFHVRVEGPGGATMFNGTVRLTDATAYTALDAAGGLAGFTVIAETHPGHGPGCHGTYVVQVGPHRASGAAGWMYRVWADHDDDGTHTWRHPMHSAACHGLQDGDLLEWYWTEGHGPRDP